MQEVQRLCDSVVVIAQGRSVAHGSVADLLRQAGEPDDGDLENAFVRLAFDQSATKEPRS